MCGPPQNTLTYTCTCSDGSSHNISDYTQTLPFFICQQWVSDCTAANPNNLEAITSCQSVSCGARNATTGDEAATAANAGSGSSQTTSGSGSSATGGSSGSQTSSAADSSSTGSSSGGSSSSSPSGTGSSTASAASSTSSGAGVALTVGKEYGFGFLLAGLFAVFGLAF